MEQGVRKELIKLISKILDKILVFENTNIDEFEKRMKLLGENLYGFKKALEYIQDFVNIYGLKIFYEEFNRLMECYIEIEANSFFTNKMTFE